MKKNRIPAGDPFAIHAVRPVECALGHVVYAGTKWNSQATFAHAEPPDFMRPAPHDLLIYTLEGEATYRDDTGIKTILRKGTLVWSRAGVQQSYGPRPGSRWSEFFLWFGGPLFETWASHGYPGPQSRVMKLEPLNFWIEQFLAVVQPAAKSREDALLRLCRLQQLLAAALHLQAAGSQLPESVLWREEACRRLSEGTLGRPSLAIIARKMGMSYVHFRKRFLALTGKTPGRYRTEEVIRRACALLLQRGESLTAIAEQLGYCDAFHFSRRFKQSLGVSPRQFRRQMFERSGEEEDDPLSVRQYGNILLKKGVTPGA